MSIVLVDPVTVSALVSSSKVPNISWKDRGRMPIGCAKGLAVMFAVCQQKLASGDEVIVDATKPTTGDGQHDVLANYTTAIRKASLDTSTPIDRLRALFVILYGLAMRETSGVYCDGRDRSVPDSKQTADTAEAGLFQVSYGMRSKFPSVFQSIMDYYKRYGGGYKLVFAEGVKCSANQLDNFGEGDGLTFQQMCKEMPGFSVELALSGLRYTGGSKGEWGPLRRGEVELRKEVDDMLKVVQSASTGKEDSGGAVADNDDEMAHGTMWVQWALNKLGAHPELEIDGIIGPNTRQMLSRFQTENKIAATGLPDERTITEIDAHLQKLLKGAPKGDEVAKASTLPPKIKETLANLFRT